jgi:hypothetical protein
VEESGRTDFIFSQIIGVNWQRRNGQAIFTLGDAHQQKMAYFSAVISTPGQSPIDRPAAGL